MGDKAPLLAFERKMPKTFSISFHCGVRGRGRDVSSERCCAGYAGYFANNSGSRNSDLRVGGFHLFLAGEELEREVIADGLLGCEFDEAAVLAVWQRSGRATYTVLPLSSRPGRRSPLSQRAGFAPISFDLLVPSGWPHVMRGA